MKLRLRHVIFWTYVLSSALGFAILMTFVLWEVRPRYVESMRRTMYETANLMAGMLETKLSQLQVEHREDLAGSMIREEIKSLEARSGILRVFVTDPPKAQDGYAPDDSYQRLFRNPEDPAARAAELIDGELRVSVPVKLAGRTVAMVGVGRRLSTVQQFITGARLRLALGSGLLALVMILAGWFIASRVARSIERLTEHVRGLKRGENRRPPSSRALEVDELSAAFEELREALEGKAYVEHYTQSLAHEIKAPLSAIRGAAELLAENPPDEARQKFIANLRGESERLRQIVDRLLQLASLEVRRTPVAVERFDLGALLRSLADSMQSSGRLGKKRLELRVREAITISGDRLLLLQAVDNLIQNALDFSPDSALVTVEAFTEGSHLLIRVEDSGTGIPDYAQTRVFERFYSLPRPGSGRKSSGLGLSFVAEVARLHRGSCSLANREGSGARAEIRLPLA